MGAKDFTFTTTVVTTHHLLAQAEVTLAVAFTFTEGARAFFHS
jgi:hypothetical protein